jgi:hypothetical protein
VVVLRWLDHSSLESGQELVDMALDEMASIDSNTLIFDMRKIPSEIGRPTYLELLTQCADSFSVERFAILGYPDIGKIRTHSEDVLNDARVRGLRILLSDDFEEAAEWLDSLQDNPAGPWLTHDRPVNFWATYGGATYSLPEYSCTVFRTTGNVVELSLVSEALRKSYALHTETGARVGILDTTASPPIADGGRYLFTYKEIVLPMTSGAYKQIIHVRSGDVGIAKEEAPPVGPLIESLNIPFFEVSTLEEAVGLLRVLQGKAPATEERMKPGSKSKLAGQVLAFGILSGSLVESLEIIAIL